MKIRTILAFILSLCMTCSLVSCGQGEGSQSGGESETPPTVPDGSESGTATRTDSVTLAYYTAEGLHPYTCDNAANQIITDLIYEPLFEIDDSFEAESCLAESCAVQVSSVSGPKAEDTGEGDTSEDDLSDEGEGDAAKPKRNKIAGETVCTIQLRDDVRFSDGSAMTAADVAYSLEQAAKSGSIYADRLADVQSVRVSGDSTVIITLNAANAAFETLLDIPIVSSGTAGDRFPVGTGPYQVKEKSGKAQKLTSNAGWWQKKSLPATEVGLYEAEDSDMLIFGFGSGAVSMVATDLTGTGSLTYTGEYDVVDYPTTSMIYVGCNTRSGSCQSKSFRQVLNYAFDRETLATKMLSGHAEAAALPVSPNSKLYDEKLAEKYAWSEEKAKKALRDASYYGQTLTLIVNSESTFKTAFAGELEKELEAVGISVEVKKLAWGDFADALKNREFDLYLGEVKLTANFDLTELITEEGNLNYGGYSDNDLETRLTGFLTANREKRSDAARKLYQTVAEQAPIIPLCFKNNSVLTHWDPEVAITPTQQNLFYHFADWDLTVDS